MNWWVAIICEVIVVMGLITAIAFFMVDTTLKRKSPQWVDDVEVLGEHGYLNEHVKEAVEWLETGKLWEQTSEDGLRLYGRFHRNEGSHTYAVCCHGYKNQRMQDISNQAKRFYEMGHNVFAGHARGHGKSEGTYIGMAIKERRDIVGWIRKLVEMDPEARIFLYGVSMGGATVMGTSGEELPPQVHCAIEDCGYSSPWEEFSFHIREVFGLPVRPILDVCQVISKKRYGFGFHAFAAKEQVKKIRIPILFIHGDRDTFVPYFMMEPLYEACSAEHKRSVTIPGAEHAEAYWVGEELYWREIGEWLDTYL
ncbi:MAG: alpha/beta hydrolase [Eubacterium sp.]|nr:alpha/beta hydrolase [Eubacterium sp.]